MAEEEDDDEKEEEEDEKEEEGYKSSRNLHPRLASSDSSISSVVWHVASYYGFKSCRRVTE